MNVWRITLLASVALAVGCDPSEPDRAEAEPRIAEKRVTFYTTYGYRHEGRWNIPLRIWVHEVPGPARRALAARARDTLMEQAGIERLDADQEALFWRRADGFIADSESRETVRFAFDADPDDVTYELQNGEGKSRTNRNGLVEGRFTLSLERARSIAAAQQSRDGWLSFRAVSDDHAGVGRVRLVEPEGLSIVSDIDDTAKITNIPRGKAEVLGKTFFKPFEAAPCMAAMYRSFGTETVFHYVSGAPWQLYEPIAEFLVDDATGFPAGSFHMKNVRTNLTEPESYADIWRLVNGGSKSVTLEQKLGQIDTLLRHFPERRFVLIGDSGEKDPEVFAEMRHRAPDRIAEIRIRDVAGAATSAPDRVAGMAIIDPSPDPAVPCADVGR